NKYPILPHRRLNGHQTIRCAIKIANTREIRRPTELSFERVGPAVVGTAQVTCHPFGCGHDGSGMMAADIEEAAQDLIISSDNQERLFTQLRRNILTGLTNLLGTPNELPRPRKDRAAL